MRSFKSGGDNLILLSLNKAMESKKITWETVGQHNKPGDVWIVIDGSVYDPTPYLNDHPGGPAVLQNRAGRDASRDFTETGTLPIRFH
jgi:cytochrome b involved in lipid metabolism